MMIKVAVVDDHSIFRKGVIHVLSKTPNIQVVLEANHGRELIEALKTVHFLPDVILLDIQMPEMNGYETLEYLKEHYFGIKVIMISMIQDQITVNSLIQKGACGFIAKNAEPESIIESIENAIVEKKYRFPDNIIIPDLKDIFINADDIPVLSEKEYELLKYSSTGYTYEQIASIMMISPKALDHYRTSLFKKLNIQSRQEMASIAVKMGLSE